MKGNNQYFDENIETAHIDAVIKGRKLLDIKTGNELLLKEGTRLKIIVPMHLLEEKELKPHKEIKREKILNKDEMLEFRFYIPNERHEPYEFRVVLLEDLYLFKKGNKFSSFAPCKCVITAKRKGEKFEANSLNQAFTKSSVKFRPDNKTHICNVFKTFFYKGRRLEDLRTL